MLNKAQRLDKAGRGKERGGGGGGEEEQDTRFASTVPVEDETVVK